MNPRLKFTERYDPKVASELDQLVKSIRTGWLVQHDVEGRHTGASGTFTTADGKTVTVVNGIVTSIV